jgi:NADPH:quinone reductase-like Zn-dependent oxidoreductase
MVGDGNIEVFVDRTYPLDQAADAHRYSAGGHAHGKIALIPG